MIKTLESKQEFMTKETNEAYVKAILLQTLRARFASLGLDYEYLDFDVLTIKSKSRVTMAVFVAFIQDYDNVIENADKEVLKLLVAKVKNSKLTGVINDVSVNFLQWNNGVVLDHSKADS